VGDDPATTTIFFPEASRILRRRAAVSVSPQAIAKRHMRVMEQNAEMLWRVQAERSAAPDDANPHGPASLRKSLA
jgi:hypothetical protein